MTTTTKPAREILAFVRKADHRSYPSKGYVFRNIWETGAQDLVFQSVADAELWADARDARYTGPKTLA
jgi:hypothetical protein